MIDLTGKVALITGSSRGIGRGCALEMARAGADIAVNYRTHQAEADDVAAAVEETGRRAIVVGADVSDREQVDGMIATAVDKLGKVDIAVCNAAHSKRAPFLDLTIEEMQQTLDVTLWGVFHVAQASARHMVARGQGGAILFISSVHAVIPVPNCVPYNTAKAGINHMASTIANELSSHRIRVNVIEPGWIDTPGERKYATEEELQNKGKDLPWGRMGSIEDMGHAATYLCSEAADYVTGSVLRAGRALIVECGVLPKERVCV